jgi:hypothetical protein
MWKVIDKDGYKLYINEEIDLQLKVVDKKNYSEIHVNYKGYNIIFAMEVWEFGSECQGWDIDEKMNGDAVKHQEEMYFTVEKKDERAFIDLIYFFIKENNADGMIGDECKIYKWLD